MLCKILQRHFPGSSCFALRFLWIKCTFDFFQFQYAAYSHLGNRSEESRNTALQPILRGLPQKWQSMARLKWIKRPGWIPLWPLTSHSNWGHDWNELTVMLRSVIWWWSFGLPSKESSGKIVQRRGTRTQDATFCRLKLLQALHWMISSRRWEWLSAQDANKSQQKAPLLLHNGKKRL